MCFTHILSFNPTVILSLNFILRILQRGNAEPFLGQGLCLQALAFFILDYQ